MKSRSEQLDTVAQLGQDHYDIVSAVMFKHVPVVTGIVGMILVLFLGLAFDWYNKRKLKGRDDLSIPVPVNQHPAMIQRQIDMEEDEEIRTIYNQFTSALTDNDFDKAEELIDEIYDRTILVKASKEFGDELLLFGESDRAIEYFQKAIDHGKWSGETGAAESARKIAEIYAGDGDKKKAVEFARKSLLLFESARKPEQVEETTSYIRSLREV